MSLRLLHEFQTATPENSAAIYSLRKTSNLLSIYNGGALDLAQPETQARAKDVHQYLKQTDGQNIFRMSYLAIALFSIDFNSKKAIFD